MDTATEVKAGKSPLERRWQPALEIDGYRRSLRSRILLPYAVLAIVLTIIATYMVSGFVVKVLETHLDRHLAARNEVVRTHIARLSGDHVALWDILSRTDLSALRATLYSLDSHPIGGILSNVTALYLLDPGGSTRQLSGSAIAGGADWDWLVGKMSLGQGPITGVRLGTNGYRFYTAGWVTSESTGGVPCILIVATPLEAVLQELAVNTLAGITIYDPVGQPVMTTVGRGDLDMLRLSDPQLHELALETAAVTRRLTLDGKSYQQTLGRVPTAAPWAGLPYLGVSMVEEPISQDVTRARLLILAILAMTIAGTMVIARTSTSNIERPIRDLMDASHQVAAGNLEIQVEIHSDDELGELAHSFNAMVRQLRQRRSLENLLGRYVGDNVAQRLLDGDMDLSGRRVWATSLFADIRDFSAFTQKVDLSELLDELNEYYETMQRVIDAHGGVVNKFGGDSILAIFGAPVPAADHADRAIQAAVEMMDELSKLNSHRLMRGVAPIRIGIGVNTGEMIEGNLGSEKRREYTVLGDSVNLAKRLSDLNKETPFDTVFVGEATLKALEGARRWQIDDLGFVMVKGQVEPIRIFSVMHRTDLS